MRTAFVIGAAMVALVLSLAICMGDRHERHEYCSVCGQAAITYRHQVPLTSIILSSHTTWSDTPLSCALAAHAPLPPHTHTPHFADEKTTGLFGGARDCGAGGNCLSNANMPAALIPNVADYDSPAAARALASILLDPATTRSYEKIFTEANFPLEGFPDRAAYTAWKSANAPVLHTLCPAVFPAPATAP